MEQCAYEQSVLFEHRFWLQILGDHARFIFNSLSPNETASIHEAHKFIEIFDQLLGQARDILSYSQLSELTGYAFEYTKELRCFKLELLRRELTDDIVISLAPTFLNHMVNELEEYLRILECLIARQPPRLVHPIHHHLLWVLDAVGHAATLTCSVDLVETGLKKTGECFASDFKELYLKAVEIEGYLRTGEGEFPALTRYNYQVEKDILHFNSFLYEILNMVSNKTALSILTPLTPDHMLREECYFLTKLAQVSEVRPPECDPTRPRFEG